MILNEAEPSKKILHGKFPVRSGARPDAYAVIHGGMEYPEIKGLVLFFEDGGGTWVQAQINGLPEYVPATSESQPIGPFGFHIHENGVCSPRDIGHQFEGTAGHYNPEKQPHGNHAGDFPVLFSNNGYARMSFYTNKFSPEDIINRSVVIHENPDDYRTQPAGNSGKRIACGVIKEFHERKF